MDSILETIFNFISEVIKLIFYVLIWNIIFFYIGVVTLKILSFGTYPVGEQLEKHINVIGFVGVNTIYTSWAAIATYNVIENKHLLAIGLVIAMIQFFLIATKYYSEDRSTL